MTHCNATKVTVSASMPTVAKILSILLIVSLTSTSFSSEFIVERNVMIPLRDGVRLATDVYRPAANGKAVENALPLMLTRTPYGKHRESAVATAENRQLVRSIDTSVFFICPVLEFAASAGLPVSFYSGFLS